MRKITKEERKQWNRLVEEHDIKVASTKAGAGPYAFIFVIFGILIAMNANMNDFFMMKLAMGCFGIAVVILLIGRFTGSSNDNEIMKH